MSTLVLGDTHVFNHKFCGGPLVGGLNRRCRDILQSIYQIVDYCKVRHGVTHVVQLGDFFDGPKPSPQVLNAALDMIAATQVEWHIIAGNHDVASFDAPSALAPMNHVGNICTYDKPTLTSIRGQDWLMVPYTGPNAQEAIQRALQQAPSTFRAAIHYGLVASDPRQDCVTLGSFGAMLNRAQSVLAYFGHEHDSVVGNGSAVSCGSLLPLNFSDVDKVPRVYAKDQRVPIPQGMYPQFVDLRGFPMSNPLYVLRWLAEAKYLNDFAVYARVNPGDEEKAKALVDAGVISGYQVYREPAAAGYAGESHFTPAASSPESYIWNTAASADSTSHIELATLLDTAMQESQ